MNASSKLSEEEATLALRLKIAQRPLHKKELGPKTLK